MARSDWNQYLSADTVHTIVSDYSTDGSTSLESTAADGNDAAEVLADSETDDPVEGRILTQWRDHELMTSVDGAPILGAFVRFADASNYILAQFALSAAGDAMLWLVERSGGGTPALLDSYNFGTTPANVNLSDGQPWSDDVSHRWVPWRISVWEETDQLFARFEEDADGDGAWTQHGEDLTSSTFSVTSGGVGVGSIAANDTYSVGGSTEGFYVDETEVWY